MDQLSSTASGASEPKHATATAQSGGTPSAPNVKSSTVTPPERLLILQQAARDLQQAGVAVDYREYPGGILLRIPGAYESEAGAWLLEADSQADLEVPHGT